VEDVSWAVARARSVNEFCYVNPQASATGSRPDAAKAALVPPAASSFEEASKLG